MRRLYVLKNKKGIEVIVNIMHMKCIKPINKIFRIYYNGLFYVDVPNNEFNREVINRIKRSDN